MCIPGKILLTFVSITLISFFSCRQSTEQPAEKITESTESQYSLDAWADSPRTRIEAWIKDVTDSSSSNFIPVSDRIAVFDNDGTLWPEQPVPNQAAYSFDYIKAVSVSHPEWKKNPVLNGVAQGNMGPLQKAGLKGLFEVINVSHTNTSTEAFSRSVSQWIDTAKDRKFNQRYKDLLYLPMVQLLGHLRASGFKTFIVSGGGADFMRVWCEEAYGIPPYQVVGSYGQLKYEVTEGKPVITKLDGEVYVDDKAGKPAAIHRFIGKVPVFCGGNSDGDQAMMQYTSGSSYKSFCMLLHHTDSVREYAYDKKTLSGHLETALEEAALKGWMVVDMQNDFRKIFAFEK